MRAVLATSALIVLATTLSLPLRARAQGLRLETVEEIRIDGRLRDWRGAEFREIGEGDDASLRFAMGHDAEGLYFGGTIRDERFVRTRAPGPSEDAVIITLALPSGGSLRALEIFLWAGNPGRSAGAVGVAPLGARPRPVRGARIVEAPLERGSGYHLEAFIPWAAIPGSRGWERGRGALRLRDVDSEARPRVETEPSTAPVDPAHLERLPPLRPAGGVHDTLQAFLVEVGLPGEEPAYDLSADVAGDRRPERVVLVSRFVVVMGEGYRDGEGYDYLALAIPSAASLRGAELRDLTGDGHAELIVTTRQRGGGGSRDVWQVIHFEGGVRSVFGVETRKETGEGSVSAQLRIRRGRGRRQPPSIELSAGRAEGLSPETLHERPATDVEPILLPWGPVLGRTYRWDGERFARVAEEPNPSPYQPEEDAEDASAAGSQGAAGAARSGRRGRRGRGRGRPEASRGPDAEARIAAARADQGVPRAVRERFRQRVNVAEGPQPETLVVLGRALLVVGPGFRGGDHYFYFDLPVPDPADLLSVEAEDVTGDGRAEIFFRVRQSLGEVQREILLVHRFTRGGGFPRAMAVEVERSMAGSSLENEVRFVGRGPRRRLEIRPGRAQGWDANSYPFRDEPAGDGIGAPQLPWAGRPARYELREGVLSPR